MGMKNEKTAAIRKFMCMSPMSTMSTMSPMNPMSLMSQKILKKVPVRKALRIMVQS